SAAATPAEPPEDAGLAPEFVDKILLEGLDPVQEELGGLLGEEIAFIEPQTRYRKKHELLARTKGKQILTKIGITGEKSGQGFLLLPLKDAVHFGGLLLMMPADAIAQTVKAGKFEGDIADAFGEVGNILVGTYSNQFKEAFPFGIGLKKESLEPLVPAQVDPAGDDPFPAGDYYLLTTKIQMGGKTYGPLEMFFPIDLLGMARPEAAEAAAPEKQQAAPAAGVGQSQKTGPGQKNDTPAGPAEAGRQRRIISIIGEDVSGADILEDSITEQDVELSKLSFESDFKQHLSRQNPCCVFLLINQVNDQGLAKTIKVRSALQNGCPLIVAGAEWTRTMVLKARQYGATDIIVTPADKEVIQQKYRKYL
ncbi:MAG: hypothetical protein ACQERN_09435, partial [Thermodesulfobacteriota bacterium]